MALLAVKHLDPVVGVDVHSVLVTPGTPPVFLPHPHVGFMLDKREYIQAAKAVVGCIATMIAQEKLTEYIEDHPEDVKKLEHLADEANQQVNELMGGGKLPDTVVEGMKLANEANKIKNRINDDLGSNVGSGGSSGRPIFVNGMMRATAGTHAYHVPGLHFPLGESFAPPPEEVEPSNDGESFMGSKTVLANNDPMSYMALEALSCWSIGMEPPPHNSAHTDRTYPSMPSSVMLPIPAGRPVLVGGPPIMNMAAAAKGLFKAFRGSKWARALADKLNLKSGFLRCNVLKAEPVDATTGEVVVEQHDFTVSGRFPLVWERNYASHTVYSGAVGESWQTPADIRLELVPHNGATGVAAYFPDHSSAFDKLPANDGWTARMYDRQYDYALYRQADRLILRTRDGIEYGFILPLQWRHSVRHHARLILPIKRISDLNDNAWVFERDPYERLTRVTEWTRDGPTARSVECETGHSSHSKDHSALLLTALILVDEDGHAHPLVTYEHDGNQNLSAAIDAMAAAHRFDYTDGHRMVRHTSARGVSFNYAYRVADNGIWRVERAWGDHGLFDYRFAYDIEHNQTAITDSLGHVTILQLNEQRTPVAEIDPLGGITSYKYDSQGRASSRIDPVGRAINWCYDRYGNVIKVTLPDGETINTKYDTDHRPVCVMSNGYTKRYEWDVNGNLLMQMTPSGAISRFAYNEHGQLAKFTGPLGAVTRFEYDRTGNPAALINALGHRVQYRHDARGNLVETIDAFGQHSYYHYDRSGNLTRAIEPGGVEIQCAYDTDGNLIRYRDAAGCVTQIDYSALGEVERRVAPDGTAVQYRYDTENRLICVVNERGELYELERDALGRVSVETDYWGQARRYQYGNGGELLRSTDPCGREIEYETDRRGRITRKRVPDPRRSTGIRTEKFSYDLHGNLIVAENDDYRVELTYDPEGRVIQEKQGDDFVITETYDISGNRTERRTELAANGALSVHTVRYEYDALDAISSIQIDDSDPIAFERDVLGRINVELLGEALRRELSYTAEGSLANQVLVSSTGPVFSIEYTYESNGELTEKRDSRIGVESFRYDPLGRLVAHFDTGGKLRQFLYDPTGSLLTTRVHRDNGPNTAAPDAQRDDTWVRDGKFGDCYFAFDRSGNLVHKQSSQRDLTLLWDGDGLLVESRNACGAAAGVGRSSYAQHSHTDYVYDALHRRVKKITHVVNGTATNGTRENTPALSTRISRFFWSGNAPVTELIERADKSGKVQSRSAAEWVYYPGTFRPLASIRYAHSPDVRESENQESTSYPNSSNILFFHLDVNGSPIKVTDQSGHIVLEHSHLSPGYLSEIDSIGTLEQPLRFQGQYFDNESGLHYNLHRYYDPEIGCYISQDPIGLYGGTNLYQYATDPLGWIDPLGLAPRPSGHALLRGDAYLHEKTNAKGIGKPHIDADGNLVPANIGPVPVVRHVLGGYRRSSKGKSPFTSFSPHQSIADGYGSPTIVLDLPALRRAIRSGEVTGVAILNPKQVQRLIQDGPEGKFFTDMALGFARRDTEYLVYGTVPSRFIKIRKGCSAPGPVP
ncbi:RHS repeat-associated core domain-containing protein [Burkholderia sp. BCC1999]|uniref:RHS repeat-associated core domain-containing protein n=1 Tax=Burkholderia sp. BCC1999 TaxID=2817448 RepID=UPI002AC33873|nr:RHS repeat-associated core domain-containing protein [Burkholderia sp. BCC1999]